jgi:hypothetical protein
MIKVNFYETMQHEIPENNNLHNHRSENIKPHIGFHLSYLSICGSTALVDLGSFFSFLIYTQSVGLFGRGSARRKAATYKQNKINTE